MHSDLAFFLCCNRLIAHVMALNNITDQTAKQVGNEQTECEKRVLELLDDSEAERRQPRGERPENK